MDEYREPVCYYCQEQHEYQVIKKEILTPEVMAKRMRKNADRTFEFLQKAYEVRPDDANEDELIEALLKAKEIRDKTYEFTAKLMQDDAKSD